MVYLLLEIHILYRHDVRISQFFGGVGPQITYAIEKFAHFLDFGNLWLIDIVDIIFFRTIQLLVADELHLLRLDNRRYGHYQLRVVLRDTYKESQI